ncbi:MAG TPA: TonB-dependent receptor [Caulobacteraceae bacterium]|jgi:outer membrane receptor protein involved in Fe transport
MGIKTMGTRNRWLLMAGASASVLCLAAPAAYAQDAAAPNAGKDANGQNVEEVVVTASRVERRGFVAPTPTTVLGQKDIELRAPSSVVALVNEVPSFRPSNTSISRPAFQGSVGVAVDLRGLGNRRTLALVDQQRFTPAASNGVVDLNLIPTNMLERADVVTGGASAAYGSDAVSGVVNFITRKRITGVEGELSGGMAQAGDDGKAHFALATGGDFNDDKGHFAVGGEWYHEGIINDTYARDWGQKETGTLVLPATRAAGLPGRLVIDNLRTTNQSTFGGVVINGAGGAAGNIGGLTNVGTLINNAIYGNSSVREVQFGTGGTVLPYNVGQTYGNATSSVGGGNYGETGGRLLSLSPEQNRWSMLGNFDYEITPSITAKLQVNFANSDVYFNTASRRDFNTVSTTTNPTVTPTDYIFIRADNAYLPSAIRAVMPANSGFYMGRVGFDLGLAYAHQSNSLSRVALSFEGKIPDFGVGDNWKWDVSAVAGRVFYNQRWDNETIESHWQKSYDAVVDPTTGQTVCRVNLPTSTNKDAACVPFNPFGYNSATNIAAVRGYVEGTLIQQDTYDQEAVEGNISGEPFKTWAGPVSVVGGLSWRKDSVVQVSDATSQATDFDNQNPKPFSGAYSTKEIYAETVIPLLKDQMFAKSFDLNGAIRRTEYSTSGAVTTWKVGGTWQVIDDLRFRATTSRDIRAPNLIELYGSQQAVTSVVNDYTRQNTGTIQNFTVGNTGLKPEIANTWTAGVVVEPHWIPRFHASIDFWHITIDQAIASYTPQAIVDRCKTEADAGAPGFFCGQLITNNQYNSNMQIFGLKTAPFNLVRQTGEGMDFEATYSHPLPKGNLNLRFFATYLHDLTLYDVTSSTQYAGSVFYVFNGLGGAPHWQWTMNTDYNLGPATISLQTRFIGSALIDPTLIGPDNKNYSPTLSNSVNVNRVGDEWYFNLSGTYNIVTNDRIRLQAFAVINNLFDKNPPWEIGSGAGTNGQFYDSIGRTYQAGIRFKF